MEYTKSHSAMECIQFTKNQNETFRSKSDGTNPDEDPISDCYTKSDSVNNHKNKLNDFIKKPPTSFINSEDWGLYLRICCHLRQIKSQYNCTDDEAQCLIYGEHTNKRKTGSLIRLIIAFNRLYAEYSHLFDSIKVMNRQNSKFNLPTKITNEITYNLNKNLSCLSDLNSKNTKIPRLSTHLIGDQQSIVNNNENEDNRNKISSPIYQTDNNDKINKNDYSNKNELLLLKQNSHQQNQPILTTCKNSSEQLLLLSTTYNNNDLLTSMGTIPNSNSTSIHLTPGPNSTSSHEISDHSVNSLIQPKLDEHNSHLHKFNSLNHQPPQPPPQQQEHQEDEIDEQQPQLFIPSQKQSQQDNKSVCFKWCRRPFDNQLKLNKWLQKTDLNHTIIFNTDYNQPEILSYNYYDFIRRNLNQTDLYVYNLITYQYKIEHRTNFLQTNLNKNFNFNDIINLKFNNELIQTIRLPIALELLLPKMQNQIEEIMSKCPYIYDPLEIAAELRQTNYNTQLCIDYFEKTYYLRNIIQEFITLPLSNKINSTTTNITTTTTTTTTNTTNTTTTTTSIGKIKNNLNYSSNQNILLKYNYLNQELMKTSNFNLIKNSKNYLIYLDYLNKQIKYIKKYNLNIKNYLNSIEIILNQLNEKIKQYLIKIFNYNLNKYPNLQKLFTTTIIINNNKNESIIQIKNLMNENNCLKTILKMEELRRKTIFNMIQEYLGNIRIYCRCRTIKNTSTCINIHSIDTISLNLGNNDNITNEQFKFDRIFDGNTSQSEIYTELAPFICSFLDGYNVCFLTYGGEASGKTYTLLGSEQNTIESQGIIQRALRTVLSERDIRQPEWEYEIHTAAIEIYNDSIIDLLSMETGIHVRVDLGIEYIMQNMKTITIENENDIEELLKLCRSRRHIGRTALNLCSSRSHLIIFTQLNASSRLYENKLHSILALCDLAGFEDIIKAETLTDPMLAKEAGYINRSLTALNRLFMTLRTQEPNNVSYRDSKLTYLLKPFFTLSGKCILIVTIRTDRNSLASTQSTLRFARESRGVNLGRAKRQFNLDKLIDGLRVM